MAFTPRFRLTNTILKYLTEIEHQRGFLQGLDLSSQVLNQMERQAFILEAHHTTHIEGTQLTMNQAGQLLDGIELTNVNIDDSLELINYRKAFKLMSDYIDEGGPLSEAFIRQLHSFLVSGVRGNTANPGTYRTIQNYVVNSQTKEIVYTPPPPFAVPVLMQELVDFLNSKSDYHPLLISGIAQFQLVHIHPFIDGNGRTSRLLSMLIMYRNSYDFRRLFTISQYYDQHRLEFYHALQSVRVNNGDLSKWLEFFLMGLYSQLDNTTKLVQNHILLDSSIAKSHLSQRHVDIMSEFISRVECSINDLVKRFPDVSERTLQRDLNILIAKHLIIRIGSARQTSYRIKQDVFENPDKS